MMLEKSRKSVVISGKDFDLTVGKGLKTVMVNLRQASRLSGRRPCSRTVSEAPKIAQAFFEAPRDPHDFQKGESGGEESPKKRSTEVSFIWRWGEVTCQQSHFHCLKILIWGSEI